MDEMDKRVYSSNGEETTVRIQCPSCPKCDKAITLCFRYGDRIKSFYVDLTSIKWELFKDDAIKQEKVRHALSKWKPKILPETEQIARLESFYLRLQTDANRSLNKDQRWDLICRIQLTYLLSCLANDAKKEYATIRNGTRVEFTLPEASVDLILNRVTVGSNFMEKHAYSGHAYYADLFNNIKRFELIRQYLVVETLCTKFPEPSDRKQLERFGQLLFGKRKWSDDEEKNLSNWLCGKKGVLKVNLSSSAKSNVNFIQRLDMNDGNWFKCTQAYCEAVFSLNRYSKCPECLEKSDSY